MIKDIKLKFGRAEGLESETIPQMPITIFVGPNNSGKSKALAEIQLLCSNGSRNKKNVIIDHFDLNPIRNDLIESSINSVKIIPDDEDVDKNSFYVGRGGSYSSASRSRLKEALLDPNNHLIEACQSYLRNRTIILNGANRINLVNQQSAGNLKNDPKTTFQVLFRDEKKRNKIRKIIYEAFGKYLIIDPTDLGRLSLRLSSTKPDNLLQEIGIHKEAISFHENAEPIQKYSDGVKAFTGMLIEMIAGEPTILLIDEPEAFLHPSLSFKLGKEVSEIMSKSEKRLFVSTHSTDFVMGCIQSGVAVNIVRLTYRDSIATARILPNDSILKLMRNPLLRSTGIFSGIFYEFVVVTEADTDRAFYQEINDRLLKHADNRGIPNCLFINAQNKQTIKTIIKPLRELGIPVAGIVDIDVLKDGGKVWTSFLDCGSIPEIEQNPLASLRQALNQKFKESGKNMKVDGGANLLQENDKEALVNLFNKLSEYGLFVVPYGEVECWLTSLKATGHGPNWLVEVFEKMGEKPSSSTYVMPEKDNVWEFIDKVAQWLLNPKRLGIPK